MNALKLVGLVLVAGWAAGTVGGMVGSRKGRKDIDAAAKANASKGATK